MNQRERLLEQALILRCQTGDQHAFAELVERYHAPLRYYIRRLTGCSDRADDILQNVWLTVFRTLPKLGKLEAFSVWLYRIARNQAIQERRDSKPLIPLDDDITVTDVEPEEETFSAEDAARIHAALDGLQLEHREVLVLRFLEQMSYQDIALVLDCMLGTVKSRIYYAKRALRRQMEEMSDES